METGLVYAIGAAIAWGLVYTIDQKILYNVTPATLLFISSAMSTLIMLPFTFFGNSSAKDAFAPGKANLLLIVISAILVTLANYLILSSIQNLNAATASIIEISYPFFVVLFSYLLFHSTPNIYFFIGGLLVFVGSFIIIKFAS